MSNRRLIVVELAILLVAAIAAAQTTGVQASGNASSQTSVSAGGSGAHANSQTSANVDANAQHSGKHGSNAAAGNGSADLAGGSTINAVLSKPVDVKKNKPGDEVTAKVEQNVKSSGSSQVVIPKGSHLVGHVTEAKRREKDHPKQKGGADANAGGQADSALGIVFDKVILKNGQEIPLHAVIQAVGAAQQDLSANAGSAGLMDSGSVMDSGGAMAGGGGRTGGGLLGGVGSTVGGATSTVGDTTAGLGNTVGGTVNATTNTAGNVTGNVRGATTASGQLTSSANGVVGLQGLNLSSAASGSAQGASVITSSTRDVHLDSGVQMLLRVTGSTR